MECDLLAKYKTSVRAAESLECTDTRHELDKYLSLPVRDSNPLSFRKLNEEQFHPYPVEQNGSDYRTTLHYAVYHLPAIAASLFYWIRMKVVQQLTCVTLQRPNGPVYSTGAPDALSSEVVAECTVFLVGNSSVALRVVQNTAQSLYGPSYHLDHHHHHHHRLGFRSTGSSSSRLRLNFNILKTPSR